MTNLQPVVPPPFLAELPDVHATTHYVNSDNWSGYAVTGSAAEFTSAEAIYDEPQYESSRCSTNSAVDWAGVGGYSSNVIGQDGTSYNVPGMTDHQAWSEVYPDQDIVPQDLYATVNEEFEDYANWLGSSSGWQFFMKNYYTGDYLNYVVDIDDYSGSRAEVVVERLSVGGEFTNLSNFDTDLAFYDTYANNIPLNDISPFYDIDMVSSTTGDTLAETGVISGPGAFTVTQTDCS